ncbi:MAG: MlaD family protein [Hyphomonadaceae bacterium]|nr:MlaD family protein [Hyphomonadaceae bacterium]
METKANYVLIGGATVAGVILFMLFAMWMSTGAFRRGFNEYDVVFADPVRGLTEGGEVRFNGIKVGEVQTLRIDPSNTNRVIARIRVSAEVPVREDSTAQLEPIGLTGVTLIQLTPGTDASPVVRATFGGPPPRLVGRGSQVDALLERSEDIALRASEAMAAVRDLLTDENLERVTRIIENLETISGQLADSQSIITQSGVAARDLSALTRQMQGDLANLDEILEDVGEAAEVAGGQTLPELALAAEEIRRAAASINRVAENLEESPSVLTPQAPRPTVELRD